MRLTGVCQYSEPSIAVATLDEVVATSGQDPSPYERFDDQHHEVARYVLTDGIGPRTIRNPSRVRTNCEDPPRRTSNRRLSAEPEGHDSNAGHGSRRLAQRGVLRAALGGGPRREPPDLHGRGLPFQHVKRRRPASLVGLRSRVRRRNDLAAASRAQRVAQSVARAARSAPMLNENEGRLGSRQSAAMASAILGVLAPTKT